MHSPVFPTLSLVFTCFSMFSPGSSCFPIAGESSFQPKQRFVSHVNSSQKFVGNLGNVGSPKVARLGQDASTRDDSIGESAVRPLSVHFWGYLDVLCGIILPRSCASSIRN